MPRRSTLLIAAVWPFVGALIVATHALAYGRAASGWGYLTWVEWSLLTPLVVALGRRFPRQVALHCAFGIAAGVLHLALFTSIALALDAVRVPLLTFVAMRLQQHLTCGVLNYWLIVLADRALQQYGRARGAELDHERLAGELAAAELDALRRRVRPELLLPALERIKSLMRSNPAAAESEIYALSRQLREVASETSAPRLAPSTPSAGRATPRILAAAASLPLLFGAYRLALRAIAAAAEGQPLTTRQLVADGAGWVAAAALAPLLVFASNRLVVTASNWRRSVPALFAVSAFAAVAANAVDAMIRGGVAVATIINYPLTLKLVLALATVYLLQSLAFRGIHDERRTASLQLERRLTEAKLEALRTQLAPHFLFNALNSIVTLVNRDPNAAAAMLDRLRRLFELSLSRDREQEVPLRDELEFLEAYIDVERMRFGDRLRFDCRVDASLLPCRVPALLLQPIVENAIRHGIAPRAAGGRVTLRVARRGGQIVIEVEDDGRGLQDGVVRERIGLSNIRARLAHLYRDHELTIGDGAAAGACVRIRFPLAVGAACAT